MKQQQNCVTIPRELIVRVISALQYEKDANNPLDWHHDKELKELRLALEHNMSLQQNFDCFSSNEGDTWHDYPADSQIIEDVFGGDMPVVGDEYEITAGWCGVTAKYRITSVNNDGECEAECISHPQENVQQPSWWLVQTRDNRHFLFDRANVTLHDGETITPLYTRPLE